MKCQQCATEINDDVKFCRDCDALVKATVAHSEASVSISPNAKAEAMAHIAWKVVKSAFVNPMEELPATFHALQKREALEAGLAFAGLFDLCAVIGLLLIIPHWAGSPRLGDVFKLLVLGLVPAAAMVGAGTAIRKLFKAKAGIIESDVFVAGISILPVGLLILLAGILGAANYEIVGLIGIFALAYTILILYAGCARITEIRADLATPAVAVVVLSACWLSKIAFEAIF